MSEQIETSQEEVIIFQETDALITKTVIELKRQTITDEAIALLKEKYANLVVNGIEDLQGYKYVKAGISELRTLRTSIEKKRKELTEPALKFQRQVKAEADRIVAELKPMEDRLNSEAKRIEDAKEAKRKEEYQKRITLLNENGFAYINGFFVSGPIQLHSDEISNLNDEQMQVYINHGQAELARVAAEAKRKEDEAARLAAQAAQLEADRAEMARMREALEKQQRELEAQKRALEQTYDVVVEPEQPIEVPAPVASAPVAQAQPEAPQVNPNDILQAAPVEVEKDDFTKGFHAFRDAVVKLAQNKDVQLSRAMIANWALQLPVPKH